MVKKLAPVSGPGQPKEDTRPLDELLDFIEGNSLPKTTDSKKAAKKARQKEKKLLIKEEEEEKYKVNEKVKAKSPDVTITMLKDDPKGKGKKGSKKTEEVVSTIPSATAQSIRDRIKSQVGEVAKKMGSSDQPQMVTIRRVMEPNSSEPTVTITLKGATPDKDKVLFTLVNGQNEVVCHDQANAIPKSRKQRKQERRLLRQQQQEQIQVEDGGNDEEMDEDEYEAEEVEEIDLSQLTKTQRKKYRRQQRKEEEERLAEEFRRREEFDRQQREEEKRRKDEEERLQQQRNKKNAKKEKNQKSQNQLPSQAQVQPISKKNQKAGKNLPAPEGASKSNGKGYKSSPVDSDEEFMVPIEMTKKERKKARKLQQQQEEEERRQRQKEEEEMEKQRLLELKEQKKRQKEQNKLKQQQQKDQEKQSQKQRELERRQQNLKQTKQGKQQGSKTNQKQGQAVKSQQQQQQQQQATSKRGTTPGSKITTSIIPNPLTLGSYMPPVGSLEWTTQALAASRPSVTIQPASASHSSLGGLEQRFSTTLTLNGKPIAPPPRQMSPEPAQDFSLENLKLPPGITITKVDPSQVSQRKPPVSKPQVTKTVVPNPPPTTIIAAPLSGSRPSNYSTSNYSTGNSQDPNPNSNVIVVDTGKLKQDIAKREEEPEQVVSRKKKKNKNKGQAGQAPAPYLYGMNAVSITPAGQPPPLMATPVTPPPQAAIIKMSGNMVTIRNPAIHPTPHRYVAAEERKPAATSGPSLYAQSRNRDSNPLPPRFANTKPAQPTSGMNGFIQDSRPPAQSQYHPAVAAAAAAAAQNQATPATTPTSLPTPTPIHAPTPTPVSVTMPPPGTQVRSSQPFEVPKPSRQPSRHLFEQGLQGLQGRQGLHGLHSGSRTVSGTPKHVIPPNYAAAMEGKKAKLKTSFNNNDDWQLLDSVFAPKDIDLEDGDIDDDERELEAFKRFCLQSVPPKRKEKVHLNIEDIVLKKKSSAVSCT